MLSTDTLTCEILPNAIKNNSLSCSMPPLEHLQLWSAIGDLATALVTVLLAVFAYRAWRVSRKTLERMEADSEAQQSALLMQIRKQQEIAELGHEKDRQLAHEQRSSDALIEHLRAFRRLQVGARNPQAVLLEERSVLSLTWAIWAMYERENHPLFANLTQNISDALVAITGHLQKCVAQFSKGDLDQKEFEQVGTFYGNAVGNYIGNMTQWQTVPRLRLEKESNLQDLLKLLRANFPDIVESPDSEPASS